ncbi:LOW QUALITY PROTEIN: hypothetical protein ACHAW6_003399 [Cyclotella cf. meneghiniana]
MQLALLVAVLNDIVIWVADVLNADITMPCHKKISTSLGREFGNNCGRKAVIVHALYGLKFSSAAFTLHLARCLHELGYGLCLADPVEGKPLLHLYPLLYDLLVVHHNPKRIMDKIDAFLPLKPDSIGPPEMYLGAKLKKKTLEDGNTAWGLSPS